MSLATSPTDRTAAPLDSGTPEQNLAGLFGYGAEIACCAAAIVSLWVLFPNARHWIALPVGHLVMSCGRAFMNGSQNQIRWPTIINEFGSIFGMAAIAFCVGLDLGLLPQRPSTPLVAAALVSVGFGAALTRPGLDYTSFRRRRIMLMIPVASVMWIHALVTSLSGGPGSSLVVAIVAIQVAVLSWSFSHRLASRGTRTGPSAYIPIWRYGVLFVVLSQCISAASRLG
ncbi:MAG: hypothetical protein AAF799_22460 [Myxococcota bacterium]